MFNKENSFWSNIKPKTGFILGIIAGVLIMFVIGFFILLGLYLSNSDYNFANNNPSVVNNNGNNNGNNTAQASIRGIQKDDHIRGNKNAKIVLMEYSDFQCPYCARAFQGSVTEFKSSDYFKNGEVNLVFKHFPLNSIHPFAQKAAEAAECANKQGKFWEYHDILFANQNALDTTSLKAYASQVGLSTGTFNSCLDGDEAKSEVVKETSQATAAGGRGTPYFVIINNDNGNTQAVSGAVPFAQIEAAIKSV